MHIRYCNGKMVMRQKNRIICWIILLAGMFISMAEASSPMRIVFLGDSLTAGYTLAVNQAYPALIQKKIDDVQWPFQVLNSGVSGDTTAGGLRRLDWLLRQSVDVLVIALGANDGLRGMDPALARNNLSAMIKKARELRPGVTILLIGMKLPSNMGRDYIERFESIYIDLAAEYDLPLMPFLLQDVAGDPLLNLPDGIHPNVEGHRIIADNIWTFISPTLQQLTARETNRTEK